MQTTLQNCEDYQSSGKQSLPPDPNSSKPSILLSPYSCQYNWYNLSVPVAMEKKKGFNLQFNLVT